VKIRPFCNADLPQLVRLWNEHWGSLGQDPRVNQQQLEQAILSQTGFDPSRLLIADTADPCQPHDARDDQSARGWCQVQPDPRDETAATITTVCLSHQADASLASGLIQAAAVRAREGGANRLSVGVVRDSSYGLAGLAPIGYGVGVPDVDHRLNDALRQFDCQVAERAVRFTVSVSGYRPPVNRDVIQFRRTTDINVIPIIDDRSIASAALSHLDIEAHQLLDRGGNRITEVRMWFSDLEAKVMSPAVVIAELAAANSAHQLTAADSYLISAVIGSLSIRGIAVVETVIDEDATALASQLEALQMTLVDRGARWEKSLLES